MKLPSNENDYIPSLPDNQWDEATGKILFFEEEKRHNYLTPQHRKSLEILKNHYGAQTVRDALQTWQDIFEESKSFVKACNVWYILLLNATNWVEKSLDDSWNFYELLSMYKDFVEHQKRESARTQYTQASNKQEARIIQLFEQDNTVPLEDQPPYTIDKNWDVRVPDDIAR